MVQMAILGAYVLVMLAGRLLSLRQRKTKRSLAMQSQTIAGDWTALLVALSAAMAIALPVLEAALRQTATVNISAALAGLAIILVGWGVAYVANRAIGDSWSPVVGKTQEQHLVTSGVYSAIRHPLYLSGLLIVAGSNIYFASTWAWLGALIVLIAIFIRLPIEEQRLVERFGQAYIDYQKQTRAIFPWIL